MKRNDLEDIARYYETTDTSAEIETATWQAPAEDADPMITTSLRLPKSVLDHVRVLAVQEGVKTTALIRQWIEARIGMTGSPSTQDELHSILTTLSEVQARVNEVALAVASPPAGKSSSGKGLDKASGRAKSTRTKTSATVGKATKSRQRAKARTSTKAGRSTSS